MNNLTLVIPGLLGPLPELEQHSQLSPACAVLQKWLACSEQQKAASGDYYSLLAELFGLNQDFSITRITALMDGYECSKPHCLRADPVHFKADIDHAILLDHNRLAIRDYEANSLVDTFNQHFLDEGISLHVGHRYRWYLSFEEEFEIQTTSLLDAVGRNVQLFLPRGSHALNWKRLLNETQMLFHSHEVNREREAKGQMSINSLWLWGEGKDLQPVDNSHWNWMMSNEAVASGLGLWSGIKRLPLEQQLNELQFPEGDGLLVLDQLLGPVSYGDVQAWVEGVEGICQQWLEKLDSLLRSKKIRHIDLYTADGRVFKLKTSCFFKFWRQKQPVSNYVSH